MVDLFVCLFVCLFIHQLFFFSFSFFFFSTSLSLSLEHWQEREYENSRLDVDIHEVKTTYMTTVMDWVWGIAGKESVSKVWRYWHYKHRGLKEAPLAKGIQLIYKNPHDPLCSLSPTCFKCVFILSLSISFSSMHLLCCTVYAWHSES